GRPDSWEGLVHGGVATPQRQPGRHERLAPVSRHPRRDDRVHPCIIREAGVVEDSVGQELPNALRARCSEEAGEEERQIQVGHQWSKRTGNPLVAPPCRYRNLTPPASRNRSVTDAGSGCPGSWASARDPSELSVMVSRDEGPDFR